MSLARIVVPECLSLFVEIVVRKEEEEESAIYLHPCRERKSTSIPRWCSMENSRSLPCAEGVPQVVTTQKKKKKKRKKEKGLELRD